MDILHGAVLIVQTVGVGIIRLVELTYQVDTYLIQLVSCLLRGAYWFFYGLYIAFTDFLEQYGDLCVSIFTCILTAFKFLQQFFFFLVYAVVQIFTWTIACLFFLVELPSTMVSFFDSLISKPWEFLQNLPYLLLDGFFIAFSLVKKSVWFLLFGMENSPWTLMVAFIFATLILLYWSNQLEILPIPPRYLEELRYYCVICELKIRRFYLRMRTSYTWFKLYYYGPFMVRLSLIRWDSRNFSRACWRIFATGRIRSAFLYDNAGSFTKAIYRYLKFICNFISNLCFKKKNRVVAAPRTNGEHSDRLLCVVCWEAEKTVAILPCRHLCLCRDCSDEIMDAYDPQCPICRGAINQRINVFL